MKSNLISVLSFFIISSHALPQNQEQSKGGGSGQVFKDYKALTVTEDFPRSACDVEAKFLGDEPLVALGKGDIGADGFKPPKCGAKMRIKGRDGEVTARVVQRCAKRCDPGTNTFGLSKKAAKTIFNGEPGQDGTIPVLEWEFIDGGDAKKAQEKQADNSKGSGQVFKDYKALTVTEDFPRSACDVEAKFLGDEPLVALGKGDIGADGFKPPKCGAKMRIKGRDGEVTARVVQRCAKRCDPGTNTFGLSKKAAKTIFNGEPGQDGTIPVLEWEFI